MTLQRRILILAAATVAAFANLQGEAGKSVGIIDPNLASEKELTALPHMTPGLVKSLMDKRPFLGMTELNNFLSQSLKPEQINEFYGKAFVHINLNTAPDAEILMIPGAGARMLREFKEYRMYPSLAKFEREIAKYVDAKEVARLEQYVFVPVNLNTATDADILSIPGAGARMVREFKEYRPWKDMATFRREIGKYVNDKEVARLERYVTLQ
jgi:DNA uptake protein ComE-like DNA-binding protein